MSNCSTHVPLLSKPCSSSSYFAFFPIVFLWLFGVSNMAAQPDLTVTLSIDKSSLANGQYLFWKLTWKNIGDEVASYPKLKLRLSNDNMISDDDLYIINSSPLKIEAGDSVVRQNYYVLPVLNSLSGAMYLIASSDPDNVIVESDETNNEVALPIEIYIQQPPEECTFKIGTGEILCYQKTGDWVEFFAQEEDGAIQEYQIDLNGQVTAINNPFFLVSDSVFIQNNEVVKKLANGDIAWQQPVPQEVFSHINDLDAAAELADGSLVLAGFKKIPEEAKDSLLLIKLDSDFSIDTVIPLDSNRITYADTLLLPDTVNWIRQRMDGNIDILYGKRTPYSLQFLTTHFRVLEANSLATIDHKTYMDEEVWEITATPCDSYRFKSNGGFGGPTGGNFWKATWWVTRDSGQLLNWFGDCRSYTDYGPYYYTYYLRSYQPNLNPMSLRSSYTSEGNDLKISMNYILSQPTPPNENVHLDFFPFLGTLRTGDHDLMIFGKTGDSLWVHIPTICHEGYYYSNQSVFLCPGGYFKGEQIFNDTIIFDTLLMLNDYDSLTKYNVYMYPVYEKEVSATICQNDSIVFGNETLTTAGTYTNIFQSRHGCDSTVYLTLQVLEPDTISTTLEICQDGISPLSGNVYPMPGQYFEEAVLQNQFGCDSTILLQLNVLQNDTTALTFELCEDEPSPLTGMIYTDEGEYEETIVLQNQDGCDSLISAKIIVHPALYLEAWGILPYGFVQCGVYLTQDTCFICYDTTEFGCPSIVNFCAMVTPSSVSDLEKTLNLQVFPNPVSDEVNIHFSLKETDELSIEVFNVLGSRITTLAEQQRTPAGDHQLRFKTTDWPPGANILVIRNREGVVSRRLLKF
ncbi:MAG: CARDB domain-containing protein [Saprospiraceae bacterium]